MTTTTSTSRRSSSSGRSVAIACSTRRDGDFHLTNQPSHVLERTRRAFVDLPWTMPDECHGLDVVRVTAPGEGDRATGDIAITALDDVVLGCWVGDCAPIVLVGADREFAVVHAVWRGLAAGVVDVAVDAFSEPVVDAVLGPAIGPCCYEFGEGDLIEVARGTHADPDAIRGRTASGSAALDVGAAVRSAVAAHGLSLTVLAGCTGCTFDGFSHRVRREPQRHVVAAWRPAA
jgi:purine-nucleoside/S-methyl-5'-thioadenosine phosphorylase / adenosine deaminase